MAKEEFVGEFSCDLAGQKKLLAKKQGWGEEVQWHSAKSSSCPPEGALFFCEFVCESCTPAVR